VTVDRSLTWESLTPPGQYVPVDYDVVGGLSEATGKNHRLTHLIEPEKL